MSPVWILLCMVTTEAQVKVFTYVAVDPAAHNEPLAVVTGIFHVHHLMVVLMALRLCTTWLKTHTFTFRFALIRHMIGINLSLSKLCVNRCDCVSSGVECMSSLRKHVLQRSMSMH